MAVERMGARGRMGPNLPPLPLTCAGVAAPVHTQHLGPEVGPAKRDGRGFRFPQPGYGFLEPAPWRSGKPALPKLPLRDAGRARPAVT